MSTGGGEPVVTDGAAATFVIVDDTASSGDGSDPGVEAVVDNRFGVGALSVLKRVVGPGGERYGAGPYEVTLACTSDLTGTVLDVDIPGGAVRTLDEASGLSTTYGDLPVGALCTLTETDTGGAGSTSISVTSGGGAAELTDGTSVDLVIGDDPVGADPGVAAIVDNRFEVGGLEVVKTRVGPGVEEYGGGPFEVTLACTSELAGPDGDVAVPGGAVRTLRKSSGFRTTYRDLPVGALCTLTETDSGDADSTAISVTTDGTTQQTKGRSVDLVIGDDTSGGGAAPGVEVQVTNYFDTVPPGGVDPNDGGNHGGKDPTGTGPGGATTGGLPGTGSDVPPWLPWLGLFGVLVGLALVLEGRRRRS